MRASVRVARASSAAAAASAARWLRLFDGGGSDHAGAGTHTPAGGGEAVALGRDDDEVVAGQREVDRLFPSVDANGPADEGVEHRLGDDAALARPHVPSDGLSAGAVRERVLFAGSACARGGAGGEDGAGDPALAQGGERRLGGVPAVDDDRGDAGTCRGLEGGLPAPVDLDQLDQRAHDTVDAA